MEATVYTTWWAHVCMKHGVWPPPGPRCYGTEADRAEPEPSHGPAGPHRTSSGNHVGSLHGNRAMRAQLWIHQQMAGFEEEMHAAAPATDAGEARDASRPFLFAWRLYRVLYLATERTKAVCSLLCYAGPTLEDLSGISPTAFLEAQGWDRQRMRLSGVGWQALFDYVAAARLYIVLQRTALHTASAKLMRLQPGSACYGGPDAEAQRASDWLLRHLEQLHAVFTGELDRGHVSQAANPPLASTTGARSTSTQSRSRSRSNSGSNSASNSASNSSSHNSRSSMSVDSESHSRSTSSRSHSHRSQTSSGSGSDRDREKGPDQAHLEELWMREQEAQRPEEPYGSGAGVSAAVSPWAGRSLMGSTDRTVPVRLWLALLGQDGHHVPLDGWLRYFYPSQMPSEPVVRPGEAHARPALPHTQSRRGALRLDTVAYLAACFRTQRQGSGSQTQVHTLETALYGEFAILEKGQANTLVAHLDGVRKQLRMQASAILGRVRAAIEAQPGGAVSARVRYLAEHDEVIGVILRHLGHILVDHETQQEALRGPISLLSHSTAAAAAAAAAASGAQEREAESAQDAGTRTTVELHECMASLRARRELVRTTLQGETAFHAYRHEQAGQVAPTRKPAAARLPVFHAASLPQQPASSGMAAGTVPRGATTERGTGAAAASRGWHTVRRPSQAPAPQRPPLPRQSRTSDPELPATPFFGDKGGPTEAALADGKANQADETGISLPRAASAGGAELPELPADQQGHDQTGGTQTPGQSRQGPGAEDEAAWSQSVGAHESGSVAQRHHNWRIRTQSHRRGHAHGADTEHPRSASEQVDTRESGDIAALSHSYDRCMATQDPEYRAALDAAQWARRHSAGTNEKRKFGLATQKSKKSGHKKHKRDKSAKSPKFSKIAL